jgi:uncharacterized repeat protein (TIGR03803 family)
MIRRVPRLSRTSWQERNGPRVAKSVLVLCALLVLLVAACGGGSTAPPPLKPLSVTEETLYSFGGTSNDAMGPRGVVFQGNDGSFYGVTPSGGLPNCGNGISTTDPFYIGCGAVYKVTPAGDEMVLYLFTQAPGDGTYPEALIQANDGNFYGTTHSGGMNGLGTVFKLTPQGAETILYSFAGGPDGEAPDGLIQGTDGNFYGTTFVGGTNNAGTVFKLTPQGAKTTLYSFTGTSSAGPDGANPVGQLVQGNDGNFYGVTQFGGLPSPVTNNTTTCGTVFKITLDGVETILHRFSGPDGQSPNGLIQGSDGNFYGTTDGNNTSFGTLFRVTSEGVETTLYSFNPANGSDGAFPQAPLTQGSDGNFYGTTSGGGKKEGGTMFQVTPAGVVTMLYSFPSPAAPGPDTNLIQGSDGNLYGASYYAGAYKDGFFFKLVLSSQ